MNENDENEFKPSIKTEIESDSTNSIDINNCMDMAAQSGGGATKLEQQQDQQNVKEPEQQRHANKYFGSGGKYVCDNPTVVEGIVTQMNGIFEDRLTEIDEKASGDYKLKSITYKEWVDMLIGVIHHMFETLSELEMNAATSITCLEKKLNQCSIFEHGDVNNENLRHDLENLLQLIQRVIEEGKWDTTGLCFKTIKEETIFGRVPKSQIAEINILQLHSKLIESEHQIERLSSQKNSLLCELESKNSKISYLEGEIRALQSAREYNGRRSSIADDSGKQCTDDGPIDSHKRCISEKEHEILLGDLESLKAKCDRKEKVIDSMKSLAFEVADKHDQLLQQKSQLTAMEEELQQALKKIQFKDSVIKDLRRDLKNNLVKQLPTDEAILSSRQYYTALNSPESTTVDAENTDQQQDSDLNSCDIIKSEDSHLDMSKQFQLEENKLTTYQAEEALNLKIFQLELDELCQMKQCVAGEECLEELETFIQKFRNKMCSIITDQILTKQKLQNVRNQLVKIANGKYETILAPAIQGNSDCGYNSQEDSEFDNSLLQRVSTKFINLQAELASMKEQIVKLQKEIESEHSNVSSKTQIIEKSSTLLRDLAQHFANMSGTPLLVENAIEQQTEKDQLEEGYVYMNFCCAALQRIIENRDQTIRSLKDYNQQIEETVKERERFVHTVQEEIQQKESAIEGLKNDLLMTEDTIKMLESSKVCLCEEIERKSEEENNVDIKRILNENEELQILNKNQTTTIANLMEALESAQMKHLGINTAARSRSNEEQSKSEKPLSGDGVESASYADSNQSKGGGSLWNWW